MYSPVRAARLAKLPGPVEGVDDPHAVGGQPAQIVLTFLGQHGIPGAPVRKRSGDELVGAAVALVAQRAGVVESHLGAQGHEHPAGRAREFGGQNGVGANSGHHEPVCLRRRATRRWPASEREKEY